MEQYHQVGQETLRQRANAQYTLIQFKSNFPVHSQTEEL